MLKKMLFVCVILLSAHAVAETAPDCSPDKDARVLLGLTTSLKESNLDSDEDKVIDNASNLDIKLLSSKEINSKEKKQLLMRRIQKNNYSEKDIKDSGITFQYMRGKMFRQYYEIETPNGFHAIAEIYSIPHNCAVDIGNIYLISKSIDGNTPSFSDRADTPY